MAPVNVIVSGLPETPALCLKLGDVNHGISTVQVSKAIEQSTGLPPASILLRCGTRLLSLESAVCIPGVHTVFVWAGVRRALPGGKGGFGSQLKGNNGKNGKDGSGSRAGGTSNFDACRDLHGRRVGTVRRERALLLQQRLQQRTEQEMVKKRERTSDAKDEDEVEVEVEVEVDEVEAEVESEQVEEKGRVTGDAMEGAVIQALKRSTLGASNERESKRRRRSTDASADDTQRWDVLLAAYPSSSDDDDDMDV